LPEKKKQEPKEEEEEEEEKKTEKAEAVPKWAMELGAKFDKMTDAFTRVADGLSAKQADDEEEEKPKDEEEKAEKQEDEEEKPKDEEEEKSEKQEDEEEKPKDEEEETEKTDKKDFDKQVEVAVAKEIAKRLKTMEVPAEKRSKKIEKKDVLSMEEVNNLSWAEIHQRAKTLGA